MKMSSVLMATLLAVAFFSSCKKDKKDSNDPHNEMLGPEPYKVLHYSFNNNLNDGSGSGLNAVSSTNIDFADDRFSRENQALSLDPTNGLSFVQTPNLASKEIDFPFSVSLWFNADTIYNGETLLRADGGESFNYTGYWLQFSYLGENNPNIGLAFNFGNGQNAGSQARNTIYSAFSDFNTGEWYHIVVNVRGQDDMDMYINGVKQTNVFYGGSASSVVFANNGDGSVGMYVGNGRYKGKIDDYRVYKKTLSATEVASMYNYTP